MNKRQSRNMSAKKYNSSYGKRGHNYLTYCKAYYLGEDTIVTEHQSTLLCRMLALILSPLVYLAIILLHGITALGEINGAYKTILNSEVISKDVTYRRQGEHWIKVAKFIETGELNDRHMVR
jgi:hypothetical protein